MNIEDEARQEAERRWPHTGDTTVDIRRSALRHTFVKGVKWASEQADREPSDEQGPAAGCAYCVGAGGYEDYDGSWVECSSCQRVTRRPSDAEVEAAAESILYENQPNSTRHAVDWPVSTADAVEIARAALTAAQEARRG